MNAQFGVTWAGSLDERPTSVGVSLTGSTADGADLSEVLIPPDLRGGPKNGSWGVALQASHLVAESPAQKGKGLGLYGKAALADGNPNVIRASFTGGLAVHGVLESRPDDSFGVGLYWYNFSDELQSTVSPLVGFNDEQGLEVFYNLALRRWFRVAADLQVVNPAQAGNDLVVVGGLRVNLVF